LEAVDEADHETKSMRSLTAQERFQLAKQAEKRLSQLLEEEKQQEQIKQDAINERVKYFKDSMGKRYSGSSESLVISLSEGATTSDDEEDEGSESDALSDTMDDVNRNRPLSPSGLEHEGTTVDSSSQRGRRRFASMKREYYRGSPQPAPRSSSLSQSFSREDIASHIETTPQVTVALAPVLQRTESPKAVPKTRKFASLKREDFRGARGSRTYSAAPAPSPNSEPAALATASATTTTTLPAEIVEEDASDDVVIHEDKTSQALPAYLIAQKRVERVGRRNVYSYNSKELIKNATGEFGDVADILTQLKQAKAQASSAAVKLSQTSVQSAKKCDPNDFKEAVESANGGDYDELSDSSSSSSSSSSSGLMPQTADKKQKRKKFSSLRADRKDGSDAPAPLSEESSSLKRRHKPTEDTHKPSQTPGADMKDAAAGVTNGSDGAPKRRFASMKRESYKSFQSAQTEQTEPDAS